MTVYQLTEEEFKTQMVKCFTRTVSQFESGEIQWDMGNQFDQTRIEKALANLGADSGKITQAHEKWESDQVSQWHPDGKLWTYNDYLNFVGVWDAPEIDSAWVD